MLARPCDVLPNDDIDSTFQIVIMPQLPIPFTEERSSPCGTVFRSSSFDETGMGAQTTTVSPALPNHVKRNRYAK